MNCGKIWLGRRYPQKMPDKAISQWVGIFQPKFRGGGNQKNVHSGHFLTPFPKIFGALHNKIFQSSPGSPGWTQLHFSAPGGGVVRSSAGGCWLQTRCWLDPPPGGRACYRRMPLCHTTRAMGGGGARAWLMVTLGPEPVGHKRAHPSCGFPPKSDCNGSRLILPVAWTQTRKDGGRPTARGPRAGCLWVRRFWRLMRAMLDRKSRPKSHRLSESTNTKEKSRARQGASATGLWQLVNKHN